MANINNLKRIITEDFAEEDRELVDKLALSLNPFLEQLSNAFNKQITIENLSREFITITVENGTGGRLKIPTQFKTNLNRTIQGINVIRAQNQVNPATYPTSAPWISWSINANIITINNVTGIQDNNKYTLTLEVIS